MVYVDKVATSAVCNKPMEIHKFRKGGADAALTSNIGLIGLAQEAAETKRNNAKMNGRITDLARELGDVQLAERLACVKL